MKKPKFCESIPIARYKGATLSVHAAPGKALLLGEAVACCALMGITMESRLVPAGEARITHAHPARRRGKR